MSSSAAHIRRALVVAPSWLGDATMATPAFRALRAALPNSHVALLCRPGIDAILGGIEVGGRAVFDEAIVDRLGGLVGPFRGSRRLRAGRFDTAILFPNSFRTALAVRLAGIPQRIGYARDGRGILLTDRLAPPTTRPSSTVDSYCDLVERCLGIPVPERTPRLALTEGDRRAAEAGLVGLSAPFAILVPGGNNPAKRWPADRFALVADHLVARGWSVAVSGSPSERTVIDAVLDASSRSIVDLSTRSLTLGGIKAVIAASGLVVTNDTGPRHLAVAFGVPTIAIFGPTDHRWTLLPGARERILVAEPFLPENLVADDRPEVCRVDRIAVGDVLSAIDAIMHGNRPEGR